MDNDLKKRLLVIAEKNSHPNDPSHDFGHILRVLKNAETLGKEEGADMDIIIPAALFHDVINYPKDSPKATQAPDDSAKWTQDLLQGMPDFPQNKIAAVYDAISKCSFSKGIIPTLLESKILQDADGLDSTGAISIMRTCASCGTMQRALYNIEDPFFEKRDAYEGPAHYGIDLFYRRLLKVEARMHTKTARTIATRRTKFIRTFLEELQQELSD